MELGSAFHTRALAKLAVATRTVATVLALALPALGIQAAAARLDNPHGLIAMGVAWN